MAKFKRKPEEVEATQWFPETHNEDVSFSTPGNVKTAWVGTDEGPITLYPGDWIIQKPDGKRIVLADGVFQHFYQPVSQL